MVRSSRSEPFSTCRSRAALWEHGIGPGRLEPRCIVGGQRDGGGGKAGSVWGGERLAASRAAQGQWSGFSQPDSRDRTLEPRVAVAPVRRAVPAAAAARVEAADSFAGRDSSSPAAGRFEVRLLGAVGEPVEARGPGLHPDSGTS